MSLLHSQMPVITGVLNYDMQARVRCRLVGWSGSLSCLQRGGTSRSLGRPKQQPARRPRGGLGRGLGRDCGGDPAPPAAFCSSGLLGNNLTSNNCQWFYGVIPSSRCSTSRAGNPSIPPVAVLACWVPGVPITPSLPVPSPAPGNEPQIRSNPLPPHLPSISHPPSYRANYTVRCTHHAQHSLYSVLCYDVPFLLLLRTTEYRECIRPAIPIPANNLSSLDLGGREARLVSLARRGEETRSKTSKWLECQLNHARQWRDVSGNTRRVVDLR